MKRILWHGTSDPGHHVYWRQIIQQPVLQRWLLFHVTAYLCYFISSAGFFFLWYFYSFVALSRIRISLNKCSNSARSRNWNSRHLKLWFFQVFHVCDPHHGRLRTRATWPWFAGIRIHKTAMNFHPLSTRLCSFCRGQSLWTLSFPSALLFLKHFDASILQLAQTLLLQPACLDRFWKWIIVIWKRWTRLCYDKWTVLAEGNSSRMMFEASCDPFLQLFRASSLIKTPSSCRFSCSRVFLSAPLW